MWNENPNSGWGNPNPIPQPDPDSIDYLLQGQRSWSPKSTQAPSQFQETSWGRSAQLPYRPAQRTSYRADRVAVINTLAAKVLTLTFFSVLVAILSGYVGIQMHLKPTLNNVFMVGVAEMVALMCTLFARKITPLNLILLYIFAATTGFSLSPAIGYLIDKGNGTIVYQALLLTAGLTFGLTGYAWTTKRSFVGFRPYLFAGLLGLIMIGILNLVFPFRGFLYDLYLYLGTLIFSFYLVYDVQQVKRSQDTMENAIMLTIEIYLDIFNLFMFILRRLAR